MEKTIPSNWHIVCSKEHEGHKCRSIVIDKAQGIKAIYCQTDNKIAKMLFKKSRGWESEQALTYTKKFLAELEELNCIAVDQEPEFLKVIATKKDGETLELNPNSPSFVFSGKEEMPEEDIDVDKGGAGSGNWGHLGIDGQRGGSMATIQPEKDLSPVEKWEFDRLKPSQQKDYLQHRNAGMDHETAVVLAEPDEAERIIKAIRAQSVVISEITDFTVAEKTLVEQGVVFEKAQVEDGSFIYMDIPCALYLEKEKELLILPHAIIEKGGQGSGNFGHSGRAGERGGSAPSDVAQTALSMTMAQGGASVNFKGRPPKDGYMVSPYKDREAVKPFKKDRATMIKEFKDYQEKNKDFIAQKNHYMGSWVNKDKVFLDISVNVKDKDEAMKMAKDNSQLAIWDVIKKEEVTVGKAKQGSVIIIPLDATDEEIAEAVDALIAEQDELEKGGAGSGNFGHAGREGERGGSAPADAGGTAVAEGTKPTNPNGKTSKEMHLDEKGEYSAERKLLHDRIKTEFMTGKTPVEKPVAYLMGGGPASGKSSLLASGQLAIPENTVQIDADKIKAELPEYQAMLAKGDYNGAPFTHTESSDISRMVLQEATDGKYNTMLDGTGDSDLKKLEQKIDIMRSQGAQVEAHYATIDVEKAVERNLARAEKTGRYVPESVIRETYKSISNIVPQAIEKGLYDKFTLWDTDERTPAKIASAEGKNLVIHDQAKWDKFIAQGKRLSTDQVVEILIDETTGRKSEIKGDEADAFRKELQKDIELAKKNGWQIEVPAEWEAGEAGKVEKMTKENCLIIAGIDSFEVAEKRLREEGVQFDKSVVETKVFSSGTMECAQWIEQDKELVILPCAFIGTAEKGGAGSGNFGHSGREGERGGSAPADGGGAEGGEGGGKISAGERIGKDGVAGGAENTKHEIIKETLSNGHTMVYKKDVYGNCWSAEYSDELISKLQDARQEGTRLRFESGDMKTGQSWGDRESGHLGRSTGEIKIPLVVHNARSSGGGALGSIVKVTEAKGGKEVWKHSGYKPPKDGFNDINKREGEPEIENEKGGAGSGNFGHAGREGERGGSAPADGGSTGGDSIQAVQGSIKEQYGKLRDEIDKLKEEKGASGEHTRDALSGRPEFATDHNIKLGKINIPDVVREGGTIGGEHIEAVSESAIGEIGDQEAQDRLSMFFDEAKEKYPNLNDIGQAGRSGGWIVADWNMKEDSLDENYEFSQKEEVQTQDIQDYKESYAHANQVMGDIQRFDNDVKELVRGYKDDMQSESWWKERLSEKHEKGGAGSGNFGHEGREGERGGSAQSGDGSGDAGKEGAGKIAIAVDGKADVPKKDFDALWDKYMAKDYFSIQNTPEREAMGIKYSDEQIAGLKAKTYEFMRTRMTEMSQGKMPPQREKLSWELYRRMTKRFNKGGAGSGNFGHAGREGERGGSAPSEGGGEGAEGAEGAGALPEGSIGEGVKELGKEATESFNMDGGEFGEDMSDRVGSFEKDGEAYNIIKDEDTAVAIAEEQVRNDLENEPELFNQEWLQNYMTISETDRNIISGEEADAYVDNIDDEQIIEDGGKQSEMDAIQERIDAEEGKDEPDQAKLDAMEKEKEDLVDSTREDLRSERQDMVAESLEKDPIQYFVDEIGAYSREDLLKQPFMRIDIDNATEDAVAEDGWAHFLSRYDGNYEETKSGAVYFRRADKRQKFYKVRKIKIGKSCNKMLGCRPDIIIKNKVQGEVTNAEMVICKTDNEKRMVYGIFLYPEEADHDGDVISAEDIEKVAHGFMTDYRTIDEMHKEVIEAVIVESCIAWQDDIEVFGKKVKKGTWFGAVKVNDDKVWDKVKKGLYKGFSVRISGVREEWNEKIEKGGAGSGNWGHAGRAGERGGSASADGGAGEAIVGTPMPVADSANGLMSHYENHLKENKVGTKERAGYKNVVSRLGEVIATHDGSRTVEAQHIAEAIQYAEMDRTNDNSFNEISPKALLDTRASGLEVYDRMNELGASDRLDREMPKLRDEIRGLAVGLTQEAKQMFNLAVTTFQSKVGDSKLNRDELKQARDALKEATKVSSGKQIDTEAMIRGIQSVYKEMR